METLGFIQSCLIPANPFQVAIYLQCLLQDANSPSPVLNAVYSIDWAQQMAGLPKISNHPLVSLMVSASQRLLGRPKVKKDPVTPEMLKALVESKITESSKTDQFRDGAWIVIARSELPTCPVKALEEYISAAQIDLSEDLPLFRALATPRSK